MPGAVSPGHTSLPSQGYGIVHVQYIHMHLPTNLVGGKVHHTFATTYVSLFHVLVDFIGFNQRTKKICQSWMQFLREPQKCIIIPSQMLTHKMSSILRPCVPISFIACIGKLLFLFPNLFLDALTLIHNVKISLNFSLRCQTAIRLVIQ